MLRTGEASQRSKENRGNARNYKRRRKEDSKRRGKKGGWMFSRDEKPKKPLRKRLGGLLRRLWTKRRKFKRAQRVTRRGSPLVG